jgi:hypothetical protein
MRLGDAQIFEVAVFMSIGGIGGTSSFYQQDQSYWSNAQAEDSAQSAANSLINVMGNAEVTKAKGLASIANQTALSRTNSQLTALIQQVLDGGTSSSTSSSSPSSSGSSSSSTSSASTKVQPASGTGTVPVTTTTTLSSLGILPSGTLTFGDGSSNTTVYTSTGDDTIGSLITAINNGPAFLSASISNGKLTVTARNTTASVVISGSGTDATAIGFGNNNNTFQPIQPTKSATSTSSSTASSSTSSSSTSSSASSSSSSKSSAAVPSAFEEAASSAASILSASGISGSLVDMLA